MHPDDPTPAAGPLERLQLWLASRLGTRYANLLIVVNQALAAAALTFATKALGGGLLSVDGITDLSIWQTCGIAALAAGLAVVRGTVASAITGTPHVSALYSRTVRYRRDLGLRPMHHVPIRPPANPR